MVSFRALPKSCLSSRRSASVRLAAADGGSGDLHRFRQDRKGGQGQFLA